MATRYSDNVSRGLVAQSVAQSVAMQARAEYEHGGGVEGAAWPPRQCSTTISRRLASLHLSPVMTSASFANKTFISFSPNHLHVFSIRTSTIPERQLSMRDEATLLQPGSAGPGTFYVTA